MELKRRGSPISSTQINAVTSPIPPMVTRRLTRSQTRVLLRKMRISCGPHGSVRDFARSLAIADDAGFTIDSGQKMLFHKSVQLNRE